MDRSPLGREAAYTDTYTPSLLCPISRSESRPTANGGELPFFGEDVWTAYELSWLTPSGKPAVAGARFRVPCSSTHLVESKSVKLYLNSFAHTRFADSEEVRSTLESDLRTAVRAPVDVQLLALDQLTEAPAQLPGTCIDSADVGIEQYHPEPELLRVTSETVVSETLYTHLFRSICPVTGQPDWASMWVQYRGRGIDRDRLLAYLVSYRRHAAFHESTVEAVFTDLSARCAPQSLSVYGLFQRRGGVDINPYRSTDSNPPTAYRLPRQ